jgi:hypothetical protein
MLLLQSVLRSLDLIEAHISRAAEGLAMNADNLAPLTRPRSAEEEKWTRITSTDYDSAVYQSPRLLEIFHHQLELMEPWVTSEATLVEVGCGTCHFCASYLNRMGRVVGVDISSEFLTRVRDEYPDSKKLVLVQGDASGLSSLLHSVPELQQGFWNSPRIVTCVMNTLGIMPASIRQAIVSEMVKTMGDHGGFLLAVFNSESFALGVDEFYRQSPQLCGPVTEGDVNYDTSEIRVRSTGFYSHWFKEAELRELVENAGLRNYIIERHGFGLFVIASVCPQ